MLKLKLKMKQKLKNKFPVSSLMLVLVLVFSSFTSMTLQAQDRVTGKVAGQDGIPLPGVNVLQKGTSKGAVTDFDGKFTLLLGSGAKTLVFSYIGFQTKEVTVGADNNVDVVLEEDVESLEAVVVIGYAAVEREKILGSVGSVKAESIVQAAPVDALQGVQGKLSGVQVLSNNGPGEGFDIRIRGISTFNAGATGPLYVVDGQQTFNIDNLDPADIASLEVIKDGATAAIYGSRAGNGVVIIKTKSGKAGKLNVSINTSTGINTLVGQVPVATSAQGVRIEQLARAGNNPLVPGRDPSIRDTLSQQFRTNPDLLDLLTRPGVRTQTNIAISGGSEKARFYWGTGIIDEESVVNRADFRRINTRLKIDVTPSDKFKLGTLANLSFEDINGANIGQILTQVVRRLSFAPVFEPDGSLATTISGRGTVNPLAVLESETRNRRRLRGNVFNYAELKITPQLSVKSTLGLDFAFNKNRTFTPDFLGRQFNPLSDSNNPTRGTEINEFTYAIQQENFVNYKNKWGEHNFSAFAGMQLQRNWTERLNLAADFNNNFIRTFGNTAPERVVVQDNTFDQVTTLFSLFSGFSYDYKGKYLFSATVRRDGSSRFSDNNQFGYFPSGSLGWNISKENFLKNSNVINNLLLRGSYGITGNDRIPPNDRFALLQPSNSAVFNANSGFEAISIANGDLKWEETTSINLGLDLALFKNRLKFVFDVYRNDTDDLLQDLTLPPESGFSSIRANVGTIRNEGIDIAISGTVLKTNDFSWDAGFNIGFTRNEVVSLTLLDGGADSFRPLRPANDSELQYRVEEGQPIGNIVGFRNNGVFQYDESNAFTEEGEQLFPNFDQNGFFLGTYNRADGSAFPQEEVENIRRIIGVEGNPLRGGDVFWEDVNGDFVIDEEGDGQEILGNGIATTFGGFTSDFKYKNFTFGVLFDYSFGNDIFREYDQERNVRSTTFTPSPDRIENAWTNPGDIAVFPILDRRDRQTNTIDRSDVFSSTANSLYVEDGSFIKWRYARFGYDLPKKIVNNLKIGLKKVNFNFAVNNVLTWTNYQGFNPEFGTRGNPLTPGLDNLRFPNDREFLLGLQVRF